MLLMPHSGGANEPPPAPGAAAGSAAPTARDTSRIAPLLRLQDAEEQTLRLFPKVRVAEAQAAASRAQVSAARGAWLPQLTGAGAYSRQTANFVLRPGSLPQGLQASGAQPTSRSQSYDYWNFGLSLSQLVYDFGVTHGTVAAARAAAAGSVHALADAQQLAVQATRLAYFDAAAKQAQLTLAEQSLANLRRHLHQVQVQVRVGQRAPIDEASANTDVANAEVKRISAQNDGDTARATLRQAMGIEGSSDDLAVGDDVMPALEQEDAPLEVLYAQALQQRPDYAGQHDAVAQAEALHRGSRGALLPRLSASAGITEAGQRFDAMGWNWNAGAQLSWNLFDGGQAWAGLQQAAAQSAQARAQAASLRQALRSEVEKARLAVRAARGLCAATAVAETQAQAQLALAEGRYAQGLGQVIELSDAQLAASTASAARINARYGLASARANLARALGR